MKAYFGAILFLIVFHTISISARNLLSSNTHWPENGDKVTKSHYEYIDIPQDTLIWDFSKAVQTGLSHEMSWINIGDSLLLKKECGSQLTYIAHDDSIFLYSYENRLLSLRDSSAVAIPLNGGNCSFMPYKLCGLYCNNNYVSCIGTISTMISKYGTLILPNDTINNVIRVTFMINDTLNVSKDNFIDCEPVNYRTLNHKVIVERWYSSEYKYELAENISNIYQNTGISIKEISSTYLCPPDEQVYSLDPKSTLKKSSENTQRKKLNKDENNSIHKTTNLKDIISIDCDQNNIKVYIDKFNNFCSNANTEYYMSGVLIDNLGRIWKTLTYLSFINDTELQVSCKDIPPGNYLFCISIGNETITRKIILK